MEAITSVVESFKEIGTSCQNFLDNSNLLGLRDFSPRRNAVNFFSRGSHIETLKRLQREAFADISKLRDRQDKLERILSMQKHSTFQETTTRVRGEVDALGGLSLVGERGNQNSFENTGINPGISLRIAFSAITQSKDTLQVELLSKNNNLSLSKLLYIANPNKWVTAVFAPIGAQAKDCTDYRNSSFHQGKGLSTHSSPFFHVINSQIGSAIGVRLRKENVCASFIQSISRDTEDEHSLGSFGQIEYKFPCGMELAIVGQRRFAKGFRSSKLLVPLGSQEPKKGEVDEECIAMRIESLVGVDTKISAELLVEPYARRRVNWEVAVVDADDEGAWGFNVGGRVENGWRQRIRTEAFVKLNCGKKLCVKPGVVCAIDKGSKVLSFVVRSTWEF